MPAGIENFGIGQRAIGELEQHLLQPEAVNFAGVMLEDAHNLPLYQVKCQRVKIADVAEYAF